MYTDLPNNVRHFDLNHSDTVNVKKSQSKLKQRKFKG